MYKVKLIFTFLFAFSVTANALIKNVPSQFSTIQSAIISSSNGDTILVQPGTYMENINFRGKKIVLTSRYYQNNDYSFIQSTIINGSTPVYPDSASCVLIINNEDSTTVLQGFTITGGGGTKWTDEHGAGLYREGGGILVAYCNPVIQHNIVKDNHCELGGVTSTGGGGMRIGDCYAKVFNNVVTNNSARYGAAIVLNYAGGEYRNNLIYKNYGSQDYGAGSSFWLNNNFSRPRIIENNTIVFNSAVAEVPGILAFSGVQGIVRNNIIWGNTSPSNIQVFGSSLTVRYCNIQNGFSGAGNININPLFDTTNYYLRIGSPCVDKGDSSTVYNDPPDPINPTLARWPSRGGLRNDMGAYGGPVSSVIANTIVSVSISGNLINPEDFMLKQNYPNPFNPSTVISYELAVGSFVSLKVFDILGNEVAVLSNGKQNTGRHEVEFDAKNFPSGIYLYTLKTESFTETKSMILLK
ncbi:MAG: T9SS type A sorting domain-containing protein [Ignavibacteria bacterium]